MPVFKPFVEVLMVASIESHVMGFCDVERIVRLEGIGVNNAVGSDSLFSDREQFFGSCISRDGR